MTDTSHVFAIDFHFTTKCNMRCRYCHSRFPDMSELDSNAWLAVITEIDRATDGRFKKRKITFAGGEPTLRSDLGPLIIAAKNLGFDVSVVTNGLRLAECLKRGGLMSVDEIGISIDSFNSTTNHQIGRASNGALVPYREACELVKTYHKRLKINTVVSRLNHTENLSSNIAWLKPDRWKLLQMRAINGDNIDAVHDIISQEEFDNFVQRNIMSLPSSIAVAVETCASQAGTYLMVLPDGRMFDSHNDTYSFSKPILDIGFSAALKQIKFDWDGFIDRGGDHFSDW